MLIVTVVILLGAVATFFLGRAAWRDAKREARLRALRGLPKAPHYEKHAPGFDWWNA